MSIEQQSRGSNQTAQVQPERLAIPGGMHPLQQAALRLGDARDGRSRLKAKELVGLLLSYGARAWRASQPISHSRVRAFSPSGRPAVRMRFR